MRFTFTIALTFCIKLLLAQSGSKPDLKINIDPKKIDSIVFKNIASYELTKGECYENLEVLCKKVGNRISGSANAAKAVKWGYDLMKSCNFDTVYLQKCMVPKWERGEKESVWICDKAGNKTRQLKALALGGSVGTAGSGVVSKIVMVNDLEELKALPNSEVIGNIIFVNKKFDNTLIQPFEAYGEAVGARWSAASEASKKGAIAVMVRSMTNYIDTFPHTGAMGYVDSVKKIPAVAICTMDAEWLSAKLAKNEFLKVYMKLNCKQGEDVESFNVIGEMRGKTNPEKIITVGGHLDSWDVGEGAHDDGAGCVQSIEALRIFKELKIYNKYTIRAVLFMNEENGGRGGKKYAEANEQHVFAIESDAGGFAPRGFTFEASPDFRNTIKSNSRNFLSYGIYDFNRDGSGSDVNHLKKYNIPLAELAVESQRYFKYHHTDADVFENVNKRELELGAAAMAQLIWLVMSNF